MRRLVLGLAALFVLSLLLAYITVPDVSEFKTNNPRTTVIIEARKSDAEDNGEKFVLHQTWVPLSEISPSLIKAVLAGEDVAFFRHSGVDFGELKSALLDAIEEFSLPRGASTVTQQVAKNLYLSESKNPYRKIREIFIALQLEEVLKKKRILEIYLNIIEWGDGVFGAEAAARHYFGTSAAKLSLEQATFLAAILPSPLGAYNPKTHAKKVARRQAIVMRRMSLIHLPEYASP